MCIVVSEEKICFIEEKLGEKESRNFLGVGFLVFFWGGIDFNRYFIV